MHVKKGDKVIVITGKEKGKTSTVASVNKETNRVTLEGLNLMKKHTRPKKAGEKGGIISVAMSMDASNVKLADKKAKTEKKPAAKKKAAKKAE
jgi:large subunit ribosomal protein L24